MDLAFSSIQHAGEVNSFEWDRIMRIEDNVSLGYGHGEVICALGTKRKVCMNIAAFYVYIDKTWSVLYALLQ